MLEFIIQNSEQRIGTVNNRTQYTIKLLKPPKTLQKMPQRLTILPRSSENNNSCKLILIQLRLHHTDKKVRNICVVLDTTGALII